jgi:hypothetical protein
VMPESTPIYGFTSPCPDETISPAAFSILANQIDTKLVDVNNDLTYALNRYNVTLPAVGTQTITANTDTVLTLASSTYTFPVAGIWIVRVQVNPSTFPTVTMMWARIRQNAVNKFGFQHNTAGNVTNPVIPVGPMVAAAGDVVTTFFRYNGAGTMDVNVELRAKLIVRIA